MNPPTRRLQSVRFATVCGVAVAVWIATLGSAQADGVAYIRPAEAKQRLEKTPGIIVLDVRTPEEYATGHLANSVLLPVNQVKAQAGTVLKDRNAPVLIYCHSGGRSDAAAKVLKEQGYTNVMSVVGGIVAWNAAGYPTVK